MAPKTITEAEILLALEQARTPEVAAPGTFVVSEIVRSSGISERRLRPLLLKLKEEGRLEVTRVVREGLDGRFYKAPAYRILGLALAFVMTLGACASVPNVPANYECTPLNCVVVLADNATTYNIRLLRVNGSPISVPLGTAESSGRFYVPRSVLREGGKCATILVVLENGQSWTSDSECANTDEFLFLVIASPIAGSSFVPVRIPGQ